jgi:hypothetical protein
MLIRFHVSVGHRVVSAEKSVQLLNWKDDSPPDAPPAQFAARQERIQGPQRN